MDPPPGPPSPPRARAAVAFSERGDGSSRRAAHGEAGWSGPFRSPVVRSGPMAESASRQLEPQGGAPGAGASQGGRTAMRGNVIRRGLILAAGLALATPARGQAQRPTNGQATQSRPQAGSQRPAAGAPAGGGGAQAAGGPQSAAPDPKMVQRMEELLSMWELRSQADETLYAEFDRYDNIMGFPKARKFRGKALLRRPNQACL